MTVRSAAPPVEIPFTDAPWGECRWCGEVILDENRMRNHRRRWHPECQREANRAFNKTFRDLVWERDHGICTICGMHCQNIGEMPYPGYWSEDGTMIGRPNPDQRPGWQNDHIIELADGGEDVIENMQTLCIPCHKRKTARMAGERARKRRAERSGFVGDLFE